MKVHHFSWYPLFQTVHMMINKIDGIGSYYFFFLTQIYGSLYVIGTMALGAINVVRGSRSSKEELLHIYNHSERLMKQFFFKRL